MVSTSSEALATAMTPKEGLSTGYSLFGEQLGGNTSAGWSTIATSKPHSTPSDRSGSQPDSPNDGLHPPPPPPLLLLPPLNSVARLPAGQELPPLNLSALHLKSERFGRILPMMACIPSPPPPPPPPAGRGAAEFSKTSIQHGSMKGYRMAHTTCNEHARDICCMRG